MTSRHDSMQVSREGEIAHRLRQYFLDEKAREEASKESDKKSDIAKEHEARRALKDYLVVV